MYYTSSWSLVLYVIVYFQPGHSVNRNYPAREDNVKSCARRKNTITFQGPLCQFDNKTNCYTNESETNCVVWFKADCPEFNEASCEVYNERHCCKLRYKAQGYTWMEIFVANQYNPKDYKDPVYDVIEIHRKVKNEDAFNDVNQPDYPDNVLDPDGECGLKWIEVQRPANTPFNSSRPFCKNFSKSVVDPVCSDGLHGTSYAYLTQNYPAEGFDENFTIPMSNYETETDAKVKITYESSCRYILINKTRVPACSTYYRRNGIPADKLKSITSFVYMEAQFYNDPSGKFHLRYAYWNLEDIYTRDLLFRDYNRFMGYVSLRQQT